jgi:hypothetical protein
LGRFVQAARPWSDAWEAKPAAKAMVVATTAPKNPPFNTRIREKIRERIALAGISDLSGRMKRADR